MPHRGAISKIFPTALLFASLLASLASATFAEPRPKAAETDVAADIRAGLDHLYRMEYEEAERRLMGDPEARSAARLYHAGIAAMNRFLDWGDTAALGRAEARWEELSPRGAPSPRLSGEDPERLRLYRGLAGFQLSYVASLRGQGLRAAALAFVARDRLLSPSRHPAPEARAALMLYDYYKGRFLERLPFVPSPDFPVEEFLEAAEAAPASRETLLFSLFWIHVDAGRFDSAAAITEGFLHRYPGNRLARELRGSLAFRAGDPAASRAEYEKLREEYARIAKGPGRLPLGYYRSVGNLARARVAVGDRQGAANLRAEWNRGLAGASGAWLPSGLKAEVARLDDPTRP